MARKLGATLLSNLLDGGLLNTIIQYVQKDQSLVLMIRDNYLNIYYRGGNILKINSLRSFEFDPNYFIPSNKNKQNIDRSFYTTQARTLLEHLPKNPEIYFEEAKKVMNTWFAMYPKEEREEQQYQIIENSIGDDFCIIDIEYAVSTQCEYHSIATTARGQRKVPRFDIISISREGKVCVIELKKGLTALQGTAGLKSHHESFKDSIARKPKIFIEHIKTINEQMKALGFQHRAILDNENVEFLFAYKFKEDPSKEKERFHRYIGEKRENVAGCKCIFVAPGSNKLHAHNIEILQCR